MFFFFFCPHNKKKKNIYIYIHTNSSTKATLSNGNEMNPKALSLQEEAELIRNNKTIKEGHHVSFKRGGGGESSDIGLRLDLGFVGKSFKDKLVGEIPGAYTQAFDLTDMVEKNDAASDNDEVGSLRAGFTTVKLSQFTKRRIRAPW